MSNNSDSENALTNSNIIYSDDDNDVIQHSSAAKAPAAKILN